MVITDLGHSDPVLLLTNRMHEPAVQLIDRYARRMLIENQIADAIDFFHMDALSSAVPLQVDADLQVTLMARSFHRLVGTRLRQGHENDRARTLFRKFVQGVATVEIEPQGINVRLGRRANNPAQIQAGSGDGEQPIPWLGNKPMRLIFG